jgi:O-antigen/teichoic acid export membrane protein
MSGSPLLDQFGPTAESAAPLVQIGGGRRSRTAAFPFDLRRLFHLGTQGFWAIADQGLFAVSNLLVNVMLARGLSPAEYGAFATSYTVLLLVSGAHTSLLIEPMLIFGPDRYRTSFSHYLQLLQRYHWRLMIAIVAGIAVIAGALMLTSQRRLGEAIGGLIVIAPFYQLSLLARRACYVVSKPRLAAIGGGINLALAMVGTIVLTRMSLLSVFSAQLLLGGVALASAAVIILELRGVTSIPLTEVERSSVWTSHWKYGRWSASIGPLTWVQTSIYYFVLPAWGGLAAVGGFKALINLVMPVLQSDGALATLLMPEFVRRRREAGGLARIATWSAIGFAVEGIVYALVLVLFGQQMMKWVYGGAYHYSLGILALLGLLPLVNSQMSVLSCALRAREQPQAIFWATMASVVVINTIGVAAVVQRGVEGAIIGSVAGCLAQIAVMLWLLKRPAPVLAMASHDA